MELSEFLVARTSGASHREIVARFQNSAEYHSSQADTIDPVDDRLPPRASPGDRNTIEIARKAARVRAHLDETRIYLAVSILNLFKYKLHTSV